MKRRDFLRSTGIVSASLVFAKPGRIFASDGAVERWRTFEVTTRVQILKPSGTTRVWLPAPLIQETPFQKTLSVKYQPEGGTAKMIESKPDALGIIAADFPSGGLASIEVAQIGLDGLPGAAARLSITIP